MDIAHLLIAFFALVLAFFSYKKGKKQAELQLKPKIFIEKAIGTGINCKNIGTGNALNIQIQELETNTFSVFFEIINLLEADDKTPVGYRMKGKNQEAIGLIKALGETSVGLPFFRSNISREDDLGVKINKYYLICDYENIEHKKYQSKILVDCINRRILLEE